MDNGRIKIFIGKFFLYTAIAILLLLNPVTVKYFFSKSGSLSGGVFYSLLIFSIICSIYIFLIIFAIVRFKKGKIKIINSILNFSILVFFVVIVLLIVEVSFRTVFKSSVPVNLFGQNKYFGMEWIKPNLDVMLKTDEYNVNYKTNEFGFRDNFELKPKSNNETRIINVGDSFIMAASVDVLNTMSCKLEKYLNEDRQNVNYKVINLGTSGSSPNWYKMFLKQNIKKFDADYMILYIYVGNDISDEIKTGRDLSEKTNIFNTIFKSTINNLSRFSYFVAYINSRIEYKKYFDNFSLGRSCQPFDGEPKEKSVNVFLNKYNNLITEGFNNLFFSIKELEQICKENNVKLIAAIVPTKEQVEKDKLSEVVNYFKIDTSEIDMKKPQKLISDFLNQNQIINIDLLDTLIEANKSNKPYFDIDSHWNIYGNDVVARKMHTFLRDNIIKN